MKLPQFFIAITACFLLGLGLLVLVPIAIVGGEGPYVNEDEGVILPPSPNGSAIAGELVYRDQGCVYCHTQVVTGPDYQPDVKKGWGPRPTVARDYVVRAEAFPGIRRFGPDLAYAGWDKRAYTKERLYRHLFDPRMDNPKSNAPTYRFLFEERKSHVKASDEAIDVSGSIYAPDQEGYEIVPKREAIELVEYLLSLNPNYALPEAPLPADATAAAAPAK